MPTGERPTRSATPTGCPAGPPRGRAASVWPLSARARGGPSADVDLAERASAESTSEALVLAADERRIVRAATAELSGRHALQLSLGDGHVGGHAAVA